MNGVIFDTADPTLQAYWRFGETGPTPLELTGNIAGCTLGWSVEPWGVGCELGCGSVWLGGGAFDCDRLIMCRCFVLGR